MLRSHPQIVLHVLQQKVKVIHVVEDDCVADGDVSRGSGLWVEDREAGGQGLVVRPGERHVAGSDVIREGETLQVDAAVGETLSGH